MFAGIISGVLIGVIPGLGGAVVLAIFLAFVFLLEPEQALPFMVAVHTVAFTGGAITTILLAVPGTSSNAATLLDGYPMAQRGEAGRALGLALTASGMGAFYSSIFALIMVVPVLPIVMAIASPEMVFLVLLGISLIATLSRGSTIKGIISGFLGILISLIGYHLVTGVERFTFGNIYLRDGIPVVPLFIGLFALPEMFALAATGGTIAKGQVRKIKGIKEMMGGVKEVFTHLKLNVFCSFIGYVVGVIPGVGGLVASWVSYGQAKQTSKKSDQYGTGIPEGIIAPESANNSSAGGSVLTTLALGIPGSEGNVLILGAFLLLGIIPGPEMLTTRLPLSLSLLIVVGVSGLIAAGICLLAAPYLAKIVTVPGHILVPLVIALVTAGVFVSHELFFDIIVLFVFGVIGWLMRQFGYNRPAFVLGFVLGSLFEKFLFLSISAWGPLFFVRPISLVIIVITIVIMSFAPVTKRMSRAGVK